MDSRKLKKKIIYVFEWIDQVHVYKTINVTTYPGKLVKAAKPTLLASKRLNV